MALELPFSHEVCLYKCWENSAEKRHFAARTHSPFTFFQQSSPVYQNERVKKLN